ncbi:hypothetical protein Nepgr_029869 [Nepenthes gracilis]|uniref:Charged multivesicular body protein 7 n=1 Tax=Nepenthes gracilis TaxID=150966 RepID=A0AAD3TFU2_NEPGR|nr:hypothetical protein Nepgr_029869 [Nepenthes gracilis]
MASQTQSVAEFIRKEVPDWDDEMKATARFKAFSGQRSDWEPQFCFWRDLIIKIAHHFCIFRLSPSQMKNHWFNRGGLLPLCLDQVLLEMYRAGDIVRVIDLGHPTGGQFSLLFKKVIQFVGVLRSLTPDAVLNDDLIVLRILKDKAADVVKALSESQWTSSCIITMRKFEDLCAAHDEASAILSYLSGCGKAQYISIKKKELIEGVKVSLSSAAVSSTTSLDCDILQLIWTTEKLQKQLDVLDQHYAASRKSALAALKSGNKKVALRHAREHKLACENREQIMLLLNRVEEVLHVIVDMESTRKVSEAMKIGAQAMKENRASFEELRLCLLEVDENIYSQKQLHEALEPTSYADDEDDDIKEELTRLELEIRAEDSLVSASNYHIDEAERKAEVSETADSIADAVSGLKLADCC